MPRFSDFLPPIVSRAFSGMGERKILDFIPGAAQFVGPGEASYQTTRNFQAMATLGFGGNAYLYRGVMIQARAIAGIPWLLYDKRAVRGGDGDLHAMDEHPALQLLNVRANKLESAPTFWIRLVSHGLLAGDAYIVAIRPETGKRTPTELYCLRPDYVRPVVDRATGELKGWDYGSGRDKKTYAAEDVLHIPEFNPLSEVAGLAPARVVARAVDQHNAANDWNTALLQNSARPAGVLSTDQKLETTQRDSIKKDLQEKYSSPRNAGRPLIMEGGLKWQQIGTKPTEMDWLPGKQQASREIAVGMGPAPELLGDGAAKTFSNMAEARASLYTEEIFPRMDVYKAALAWWLLPMYGLDPLRYALDYDRDEVEAIQEDRGAVWDRAQSASFLTVNEKREMLGYDALPEGGDIVLVPSTMVPLDQAIEPPAPPPPMVHIAPALPPPNDGTTDATDATDATDDTSNPSGKSVMRPFALAPVVTRTGVLTHHPRVRKGVTRPSRR